MKRSSKKGFTMAELLIVIAIIAILISIMFPVFGAQLDKARAAAELSNVRAAYSEAVANAMLKESTNPSEPASLTIDDTDTITVKAADIAKVLMYENTKVLMTNATGDFGSIKVTYKDYSGEFRTDADVIFDRTDEFDKNYTGNASTNP